MCPVEDGIYSSRAPPRTTGSGPNVLTSRMGVVLGAPASESRGRHHRGSCQRSRSHPHRPLGFRPVVTPAGRQWDAPAGRKRSTPRAATERDDTQLRQRRGPARGVQAGSAFVVVDRPSLPAARPGRRSGALRPAPRSACSSEKVRRRWPVGRSTTGAIVTMPPRLPCTWCPKSWPQSAGTIRP